MGSMRTFQMTMRLSIAIWNVTHRRAASALETTVGICHLSWMNAPSFAAYMSPARTFVGSVSVPPSTPSGRPSAGRSLPPSSANGSFLSARCT
jgi:hypothetical protein